MLIGGGDGIEKMVGKNTKEIQEGGQLARNR